MHYVFEVLVSHKSRMYNLSQCLVITHIKPENLNRQFSQAIACASGR